MFLKYYSRQYVNITLGMIVFVAVGIDLTGAVSLSRAAQEEEEHEQTRHRLSTASYWLQALRPPVDSRNGAIIRPPAAASLCSQTAGEFLARLDRRSRCRTGVAADRHAGCVEDQETDGRE